MSRRTVLWRVVKGGDGGRERWREGEREGRGRAYEGLMKKRIEGEREREGWREKVRRGDYGIKER